MLVYGDSQTEVAALPFLHEITSAAQRLPTRKPGLSWHQAAVEIFIDLASLLQGVADREREALGYDELSIAQDRLMAALRLLAARIDRSWTSGFKDQSMDGLEAAFHAPGLQLPSEVILKRCEGYAFYALYPENYLEAARGLPAGTVVIGLRSIGTGLAALVAAASHASTTVTLRPSGHPFRRTIEVGPKLETLIRSLNHQHFAIVDEGPGLSGSSFGGAADWLESLGVEGEKIIFMPSHGGDPGPESMDAHRRRWNSADRRVVSFEQLFSPSLAAAPLHSWFQDLTGQLIEAPRELSGGGWAADRPAIPTDPAREARKFLLRGRHGDFILKFAGIDRAAKGKFVRARDLHQAGFCPEPMDLRYGFMIERYEEGEPAAQVPEAHLIRYCAFRRDRFPAKRQGSTLKQLVRMAEYNIRQAIPDFPYDFAGRWGDGRIERLQEVVEPVHIDGRLQWWEWRRAGDRLVKTDAVDHSESHDLVGCQDILWDVAGALVELEFAEGETNALADAFTKGVPLRRELLELMQLCYVGFQIGWWSLSSTVGGAARTDWYRKKVEQMLPA